jgi:hypothetical protein
MGDLIKLPRIRVELGRRMRSTAISSAARIVPFLASPQANIPKNGVERDLTGFDFVVLEP